MKHNPPTEEDYLVQLCDYLANKDGFVTIEQRIGELIERKGHAASFQVIAQKANELKHHFEQKIGCDIYGLLGI